MATIHICIMIYISIIILPYPMTTTVHICNITPSVDTSFKLISDFFHVNQGVLCYEHAEQAYSGGVFEGGGGNRLAKKRRGEQQASWFSKQQAVEFPQVLTSLYNDLKCFSLRCRDRSGCPLNN